MPWKPAYPGEFPTLGWYVIDWWAEFLSQPDSPAADLPLLATREQIEFTLRFYELDPRTGRRKVRRGVLSRPRGWGKSPIVAAFSLVEGLGDVVPDGWDADGRPVGKPWWTVRTPYVHVAATTDFQTKFTWDPLQEMVSDRLCDEYPGLDAMDTFISLPGGGRIEQLTSSATSVKGGKPVFVPMDQTETWTRSNGGLKFHEVLLSNLTKLGGSCIETPNAFTPGDDSVAERTFNAYRAQEEGRTRRDAGLLVDHREAAPDTDLTERESLTLGLRTAYGDSSDHPDGCVIHDPPCAPGWANIEDRISRIWDADADEQTMRSDFLNQVTHAADAWIGHTDWKARGASVVTVPPLRDRDVITMGFDGSRGRTDGKPDATALIGCRVSDGHLFKLGVWEARDVKSEWKAWEPPLPEIEATIAAAIKRFRVVGFYCDPAKDWRPYVNAWEAQHGPRLPDKAARVSRNHPFEWWMTGGRTGLIERMIESFEGAVRNGDLSHEDDVDLTRHVLNARRRIRSGKLTLDKESAKSAKKIDAAVAACLAWQARLDALAAGVGRQQVTQSFEFGRIY